MLKRHACLEQIYHIYLSQTAHEQYKVIVEVSAAHTRPLLLPLAGGYANLVHVRRSDARASPASMSPVTVTHPPSPLSPRFGCNRPLHLMPAIPQLFEPIACLSLAPLRSPRALSAPRAAAGVVTVQDLGRVMRAIGLEPTDDELNNMITEVDGSGAKHRLVSLLF